MMLTQPGTKLRIRKGVAILSRTPHAFAGLFEPGKLESQRKLQNGFDVYQLPAIDVRPLNAEPEP